jgi:hypothetical protein
MQSFLFVLNEFCFIDLDETRKILHEQECEKTLITLLTNEVVKSINWMQGLFSLGESVLNRTELCLSLNTTRNT